MLAIALALGASVAWGGSDFVAGVASRRLPLLAIAGEGPPSAGGALVAAGAGIAELLGFAALYKSLALGPMAVVAPISSAAAVVPVIASLAAGERPATAVGLGMALALAGAALACAERATEASRRVVPGASLAILAAMWFGAFFLAMHVAAETAGPAWAVTVNRATSVAVLLAALTLTRPRLGFSRPDLATVAAVGVMDAGANAMFAFALTRGLTSTVSVLGSLYPVTTVVLAALLLNERVAPRQAAGVTTVLAGIALVGAHP